MTVAEPTLTAKALARLRDLQFVGECDEATASARSLKLVETSHGAQHAADHIRLMLLLDVGHVIREARYRTLATGSQLAAFDVLCGLLIGKTVEAAATITPQQVDALLRDDPAQPALALGDSGDKPYYVVVKAMERLHGIVPAVAPTGKPGSAASLPWDDVGLFEKVRRIEGVLDAQVRPALASDGGGIDLVDLKHDDLHVQYHGACGSCSSSVGGTLQFVQDSLNNQLGTRLVVKVSGNDDESAPGIL